MTDRERSAEAFARGVERDAADVQASVLRDLPQLPATVALERLAWLRRWRHRQAGKLKVQGAVLEVLREEQRRRGVQARAVEAAAGPEGQ
jgi:hypothetical protein